MKSSSKIACWSLALGMLACSSEESDDDSTGGAPNAGSVGTAGRGGAAGSSGAPSAGGNAGSSASGGKAGTSATSGGAGGMGLGGGGASSGGAGASGTAGSIAGSGGASAGSAGSGGSAGSSSGNAGSSSGSAGDGGKAGSSGEVMPKAGMNFFVTSKGMPTGGNLDGLDGADAFCKTLATAVSATLGDKTWRAYLSTSTVDARERIGTGPWRNQAGVVIANNLEDLHEQEAGEALDDTWPPADLGIALDETGEELANSVHDILTGSNADGTLFEDNTCDDWTSDSEDETAGVGHSNRTGGGRPPYFNATHTVGCAPFTANYASGTVSQGGGRGSIYCFALEPSPEP